MKQIEIEVTTQDIAKGVPCSSAYCPVGRALRRKKLGLFIRVGALRESNGKLVYVAWINCFRHDLPAQAQRFIKNFDAGKKPRPFKFTLEVA